MSRLARLSAGSCLFLLVAASSGSISAQSAKKVLTFADSDLWRTASTPVLSPDGAYVGYATWSGDGFGESIVRHIASGKEYRFPRGGGAAAVAPEFTPDAKAILLPLNPTKAETEKAKVEKAKGVELPQPMLVLVDLATGQVTDKFPQSGPYFTGGEGAGFVVYRKPVRPAAGKDGKDGEKTAAPAGPMGGKGKGAFAGKGKGAGATGATEGDGEVYGSDLIIRDLAARSERVIPDVSQFSLSKDGQLLAYVVASRKDDTNGVYTINPRLGGSPMAIKAGPGSYANLTWDEKQTKLAFLFDSSGIGKLPAAPAPRLAGTTTVAPVIPAPKTPAVWHAFVWDRKGQQLAAPIARLPMGPSVGFGVLLPLAFAIRLPESMPADEVLGPATPGQRAGWTLTSGSLSFSADGSRLFVNTARIRTPNPPTAAVLDDFQLDIWHWRDARLQPMQKLQAAADLARTYAGVVHLESRQFRQLSDDTLTVSPPPRGSDWALGTDDHQYVGTTGYGINQRDYLVVNVRTGEARPVLIGHGGYELPRPSVSPTGKNLAAFDGKDWLIVSVPDGKKTNLTTRLGVKFFDEEDDHPALPRPAGVPQWTADGKFLLVGDGFDVWKLAVDGSTAENLTRNGRTQHLRFTLLRVPAGNESEPDRGFDLSKPHLLAAENLQTRDTGFYRLEPGSAPKLLVMGARKYGIPIRARNADVYLLTVQTFHNFPDYFATRGDFHELKRVTDLNPTIGDYNWGRAELIHYTSADGKALSGILVRPENFDPAKKYPMVVYVYERLSQGLHQFHVPSVTRGQVINPTFYASNGYLVLMPDIAYKTGAPGQSAIKCVLPAIQAVMDKGYVDEKAIGINGQSWGGYQIAYMVTQTDRFRAAVAGAPVSNMVSAYDGIRWGTGLTRQFQYEWSQSRIGATLWQAPMKFIENSPVFMADRVTTPLLMIANDQDDAVPWYQGIEYYLALRRLGKECYLLNYNGEPHNLAKKSAARDFAARMFQFFEHHLKGQPAPAWMAKGVPYLDRDKEKEEVRKLYGPGK